MNRLRETSLPRATRPSGLRLATLNGRRLHDPLDDVAPLDEPERPLEVEFVGLTEAEQRAALAAFPGGRRFILKS